MKTLLLENYVGPASADSALPTASQPTLLVRLGHTLRVLYRINPPLALMGWLHLPLVVVALVLLPLDHHIITGAPAWLKPLKFAVSGWIYLWSLAWVLADLPAPAQRAVRRISGGVAVSMLVEMAVIFGQAGRGTTSHFNQSSALDGLLFGAMGIFIILNTVLLAWATALAWRYRPHGSAAYAWGVRLGLLVFLVGSAVGGAMAHHMSHTVGAADGGAGLPGLGWSTRAGDLRAAHFLGLHALQALPLLGWALARWVPARATVLLWLGAAGYVVLVVALYMQAMAGLPLWAGQ